MQYIANYLKRYAIIFAYMDISKNIKAIREAKRLTQADLAERIGIDGSNYAKQEKRGNKLTVEQLEKIAGAMGVSVLELMTGESKKVEDSGKVEELEKRVRELEQIKNLFQDNLQMKEREFERVKEYFVKCIYNEIAENFFEKGYSKLRVYNAKTGKKIISADKEGFIELYKQQLIERRMKWIRDVLSRETRNEIIDRLTKELFQLEIGSLGNKDIRSYEILDIICEVSSLGRWEIREEYVVIEKFKQKVVNNYFYDLIGDFSSYNKLVIIFESGIITDKMLLTSYQRAKFLDEEDIDEDYEINEDLEIVKRIKRHRFEPN
jgi:transcriptional regulator with XRE-family HTH domain